MVNVLIQLIILQAQVLVEVLDQSQAWALAQILQVAFQLKLATLSQKIIKLHFLMIKIVHHKYKLVSVYNAPNNQARLNVECNLSTEDVYKFKITANNIVIKVFALDV